MPRRNRPSKKKRARIKRQLEKIIEQKDLLKKKDNSLTPPFPSIDSSPLPSVEESLRSWANDPSFHFPIKFPEEVIKKPIKTYKKTALDRAFKAFIFMRNKILSSRDRVQQRRLKYEQERIIKSRANRKIPEILANIATSKREKSASSVSGSLTPFTPSTKQSILDDIQDFSRSDSISKEDVRTALAKLSDITTQVEEVVDDAPIAEDQKEDLLARISDITTEIDEVLYDENQPIEDMIVIQQQRALELFNRLEELNAETRRRDQNNIETIARMDAQITDLQRQLADAVQGSFRVESIPSESMERSRSYGMPQIRPLTPQLQDAATQRNLNMVRVAPPAILGWGGDRRPPTREEGTQATPDQREANIQTTPTQQKSFSMQVQPERRNTATDMSIREQLVDASMQADSTSGTNQSTMKADQAIQTNKSMGNRGRNRPPTLPEKTVSINMPEPRLSVREVQGRRPLYNKVVYPETTPIPPPPDIVYKQARAPMQIMPAPPALPVLKPIPPPRPPILPIGNSFSGLPQIKQEGTSPLTKENLLAEDLSNLSYLEEFLNNTQPSVLYTGNDASTSTKIPKMKDASTGTKKKATERPKDHKDAGTSYSMEKSLAGLKQEKYAAQIERLKRHAVMLTEKEVWTRATKIAKRITKDIDDISSTNPWYKDRVRKHRRVILESLPYRGRKPGQSRDMDMLWMGDITKLKTSARGNKELNRARQNSSNAKLKKFLEYRMRLAALEYLQRHPNAKFSHGVK